MELQLHSSFIAGATIQKKEKRVKKFAWRKVFLIPIVIFEVIGLLLIMLFFIRKSK